MAGNGRRRFNAAVKARVAIEVLREQKATAQIASEFECHPSQVAKWKKDAVDGLWSWYLPDKVGLTPHQRKGNFDVIWGKLG